MSSLDLSEANDEADPEAESEWDYLLTRQEKPMLSKEKKLKEIT